MKFRKSTFVSLLAATAVAATADKVNFVSNTIGSNMVLQRDVSASVYGFSSVPSSTVTVVFNGGSYDTVASSVVSNAGGFYWQVDLPSTAGGFVEYEISISSSVGETALLSNVVFGDVYVCGGQSNMQFAVPGEFNSETEIAAADKYPYIRLFSVNPQYDIPEPIEPWDDLKALEQPWSVASSQTVTSPNNDWAYLFSAVCWEFGKNTFDNSLAGEIPVGLVSSNWGGTIVEAWCPESALAACGVASTDANAALDRSPVPTLYAENITLFRAEYSTSKTTGDVIDPTTHSSLYNSMIHPFRNMKINGAIWYQGESNVGNDSGYPCLQNQMVLAWREAFQSKFGFIYTQLSTWDNGGGDMLADMRNAQLSILAMNTPAVGMISAADLGDPESPYDPIHPRNKMEVGRRMALAGSSIFYGATNVPYTGPFVESYETFVDPIMGNSVRVTLNASTCGDGCKILPAQECAEVSQKKFQGCGEILLHYGPRGSVTAVATMQSPNVVLFTPTSPLNKDITSLTYCLGDYPLMTVYNSLDIPLVPMSIAF